MGLINVPDIQNNDLATQTLWNSRFATIVSVINGNLDAANLANNAVTTPKIANLAVTEGKVADKAITPGKLSDQPAWIVPTFLNAWVNHSAQYNSAGYYKDSLGIVHLKGLVKSGTIGAAIFNLPAGYRPLTQYLTATISNSAIGRIDVTATGDVLAALGSNAWISLDLVSFRAEQ